MEKKRRKDRGEAPWKVIAIRNCIDVFLKSFSKTEGGKIHILLLLGIKHHYKQQLFGPQRATWFRCDSDWTFRWGKLI